MPINLTDFMSALGPATDSFGKYFLAGQEMARQKQLDAQRLQLEQEDRELKRVTLKAELDRMKREDRVAAHAAAIQDYHNLAGSPGPMQPDPNDPTQQVQGQLPAIQVPSVEEGGTALTMQPPNAQTLLDLAVKQEALKKAADLKAIADQGNQMIPMDERVLAGSRWAGTGQAPKAAADSLTKAFEAAHADQRAAVAHSDDSAVALTPESLDIAANMYLKTGTLPPMGMGKAAASTRQAIINRAAQINPQADIASSQAGFQADKGSLSAIQKQADAVTAFESTATKNAQLLRDALKDLPDGGATLLNTPLRGAALALGSKGVSKVNVLRQSVANEYARIISNPSLTGVMSDAARKEGETLLSPNATIGQYLTAMDTLGQEAGNRRASFQDQISSIQGRIKGGKGAAPSSAPVESTSPVRKYLTNNKTGESAWFTLKNGQWVKE